MKELILDPFFSQHASRLFTKPPFLHCVAFIRRTNVKVKFLVAHHILLYFCARGGAMYPTIFCALGVKK